MTWQIAIAAGATCTTTAAAAALVIPWLKRAGHYDIPTVRSSHRIAVPRGGGLAMLVGAVVGVALLWLLGATGHGPNPSPRLWPLAVVPIAMGALGFVEDARGLGIRARLLGQLAISSAGGSWLIATDHRTLLWVAPAALAIAGYVNITNFMDGINGISGLHGVIAGAAFLLLGVSRHDATLQVTAMLLAASSLAFLPWNAPQARVFLGDCGSYYIGAVVATLAITAIHSAAPLELVLAPAAVYIVDTAWTMWSRYRRGESVRESHRSHVYQRLTDLGFSHVESAAVVTAATGAIVGMAWLSTAEGIGVRVLADTVALLLLLGYVALPAAVRGSRTSHSAIPVSR